MAKTYNLEAQGVFTITDSSGLTIAAFDETHIFSNITSDTVQSGVISLTPGASKRLNVQGIDTRVILYAKNESNTGIVRISNDDNTTQIITLNPQEWCFIQLIKPSPDDDIYANAVNADCNLTYILIEE